MANTAVPKTGAITDPAPLPERGAITDIPVQRGQVPDRALEADIESFSMSAGSARLGLRHGANALGAMMNDLIGGGAEALGLKDFAESRYKAAKEYSQMAERTGPPVKDLSQIENVADLSDFIAGHAGSGIATSLPVIGAAVGLRRPVAGVFGGSAALETGEQVGTLRDDPYVMSTTTAGERFANSVQKGVIGATMELGGASGQAARVLTRGARGSVKQIPGAVVKGTAGEAITEAGQDVTGQLMHQQLNPAVEFDPNQTLNAAAAGAAGGGAIVGGAQTLSMLPGREALGKISEAGQSLAQSAGELRERLNKRRAPPDPREPTDRMLDPNTTFEEVLQEVSEQEAGFDSWWSRVKETEEYKDVKNWDVTDPDVREKLFDELKARYNASTVKPQVERALGALREQADKAKKYASGFKDSVASSVRDRKPVKVDPSDKQRAEYLKKNGYKKVSEDTWEPVFKKSSIRTTIDQDIEDDIAETLPKNIPVTPQQIRELSGYIKELAFNPAAIDESATVRTLRNVLGGGLKPLLERTIERVHGADETRMLEGVRHVNRLFSDADDLAKLRSDRALDVIRSNLRPEYTRNREMRRAAENELVPQMLDYLESRGDRNQEFLEAMQEAFGENTQNALDQLEEVIDERPITSSRPYEGAEAADTADQSTTDASAAAGDPRGDARLGVPYRADTDEQVREVKRRKDAIQQEIGDRHVKVVQVDLGDGRYVLELDVADQAGLTEDEWSRIREPREFVRREGASLVNGIMQVSAISPKEGGGTARTTTNINLMKLTHLMMAREGQGTKETTQAYVSDMFSRGIAALMSTKIEQGGEQVNRVQKIEVEVKRPGSSKYEQEMVSTEDLAKVEWRFPEKMPVARTKKLDKNGKPVVKGKSRNGNPVFDYETWTYADVKRSGFSSSETAERLRAAVRSARQTHGPAEWDRAEGGKPKPMNETAKAIQRLSEYHDLNMETRREVGAMEQEAIDMLEDGATAAEAVKSMVDAVSFETLGGKTGGPRVSLLRRAIDRVEREYENIVGPTIDDDLGNALREKQGRDEPVRNIEPDTGTPLNAPPAAGPKGPGEGPRMPVKRYVREDVARSEGDVVVEQERLNRVLTERAGGSPLAPAFGKLEEKKLPKPKKPKKPKKAQRNDELLGAVKRAEEKYEDEAAELAARTVKPEPGEAVPQPTEVERARLTRTGKEIGESALKKLIEDVDVTPEEFERALADVLKKGGAKFSMMSNEIHEELGGDGFAAAHDSPIRHEGKFDWRKNLGKGEGHAAFGAGTYLSTSEGVHKNYKKGFTGNINKPESIAKIIDAAKEIMRDPDEASALASYFLVLGPEVSAADLLESIDLAIAAYERHAKTTLQDSGSKILAAEAKKNLPVLKRMRPNIVNNFAALRARTISPTYHVTVNAKQEEFLDWDKPLSEQSKLVQNAVYSLAYDKSINTGVEVWGPDSGFGPGGVPDPLETTFGEVLEAAINGTKLGMEIPAMQHVYNGLAKALGSQRAASERLQSLGIVGHRYAANGGKNDKFPNYVIYDDSRIETKFVSFSSIRPGPEGISEVQKKQVKEYVEKVLGDRKTKVLFRKMEEAGAFADMDGVETLMVSVNAIDPMSVAYHESLHALFARIRKVNKGAAETLLRAATAPQTLARLRQLLKDEPEALKQLSDPEEALAYMYQFWAAGEQGLLTIGPKTRTWFDKIKSFFRVVAGLWGDQFNTAVDIERAGDILAAFHRGEMSKRSHVAKVLKELSPDYKAATSRVPIPGMLHKLADKFIYTATGAVRGYDIPAFNDIMDKFHTTIETSGKGPGMLQAKHVAFFRMLNRVSTVLANKTEEQQKNILEELRSGKSRNSREARVIEGVLKEAFQYMKGAGVKATAGFDADGNPVFREIREIKDNYFPRVYDSEKIRANKGKFVAVLKKHGVPDAEKLWEELQKSVTETAPSSDVALGVTLFTPNINERTLNSVPDSELAEFMVDDLFGTMSQYLARAARRAEYARRFGNAGEAIEDAIKQARQEGATTEQIETFQQVVKALEGTLGSNMNQTLRNVYGAVTTYQNVRLLPLALLSSLVDPIGLVVRGASVSEAFGAFKRGITDLVKVSKDDAYYLAQTVGAINIANDAAVVGDMYSSQFMPEWQRNINEKFFRYNGMESWNRSMRVAATAAAEQFIIRHVTKPNEHSARYLEELGLTRDDVSITDGKIDMNQKTVEAINMWVDGAIIRPNAAHRPVYMSDPNWVLVSHLKQYMYMYQKTIIARAYHEMQHGNVAPVTALLGYVPVIVASDMLRVALTPGDNDDNYRADWGFYEWFMSGVQRAGLFGPGQMVFDSGMGTNPAAIAGPTAEQIVDFVKGAAPGGDLAKVGIKAVPGLRYFQ